MPHSGASIPCNEQERLNALQRLRVLDTQPEPVYDHVVKLAAHICGTPISLVSLVDAERQWFKARLGLEAEQTHRDLAFCGHALLNPTSVLVVEDALLDARFNESPLVLGAPFIRFYAGAPIVTDQGHVLGTVCVIDTVPKRINEEQRAALGTLASQAASFLQMRELAAHNERLASSLTVTLAERDQALQQAAILANEIDHRVMNSLHMTAALLELQALQQRNTDAGVVLRRAVGSVRAIANVHKHLCHDPASQMADAIAYLTRLCDESSRVFDLQSPVRVIGSTVYVDINVLVPLGLIVNELVTNSCKHGAQQILVHVEERKGTISSLSVLDDGPGPPDDFSLSTGKGLGMKIIQSLTAKIGGKVSIQIGPNGKGAVAVLLFSGTSE